jgi:tetratricopeptide (TPR) repeat protein
MAVVHVYRNWPGLFEGGKTFPFEKQTVYYQPDEGRVNVGWHSAGDVKVQMSLHGFSLPQGPVLRAYLFRYRSLVEEDLQAVQKDVEILRTESRINPKSARLHLDLARKYKRLGDNIMAAQEYHISVDADRNCYECYLEMGLLYFEVRHWDLSIRALRKAAKLRPEDPHAHMHLGDVFYRVENGLEAGRAYRRAVKLGLDGPGRERADKRIEELKNGKFMLQKRPPEDDEPTAE